MIQSKQEKIIICKLNIEIFSREVGQNESVKEDSKKADEVSTNNSGKTGGNSFNDNDGDYNIDNAHGNSITEPVDK